MSFIRIDIKDEGLTSLLQEAQGKIDDLSPVMLNISEIMYDDVMENFEQQGRPRWPALKESTIAKREAKGYWPGKILQMRGELVASITSQSDDSSATVGTNKEYAAAQQFGAEIPMPARTQLAMGFKTYKKGPRKGKTLFAKASKADFTRPITRGPYTIKLPPRPFLVISQEAIEEAKDYIGKELTSG